MLLLTTNPAIPFTLRRVQYPLMPCWAMTVHKSQGQTLDKVGIFFPRPTWAHGLLYVAVSRVRRTQDCFWLGEYGGTIHNFCSKHVL
jgi:ATP-dependent exoDNAse (exonuclease V) alpha subunit